MYVIKFIIFLNQKKNMEIDENQYSGQINYKKQWAYFNMLKKRGIYLLKHLKKIEVDFLKKYKQKNSSEKQFLIDVKIIFSIYEILVTQTISDLEFTELQNFGQGIRKLFQQIIMIISYLIQSFIIKSKDFEKQKSEKQNIESKFETPQQQQDQVFTQKKIYQINQKTIFQLKQQSRLYDLQLRANQQLLKLQQEVLSRKAQCLEIKQSSLEANLKQAYQYLSKYSRYSKILLDKTEKRLKEEGQNLVGMQSKKVAFIQQQSQQRKQKQNIIRQVQKHYTQFLKKNKIDKGIQTQNLKSKLSIAGQNSRLSLKKNLQLCREQLTRLYIISQNTKIKLSEETASKQKYVEENKKQKQKNAELNTIISQYKQDIIEQQQIIKKLKQRINLYSIQVNLLNNSLKPPPQEITKQPSEHIVYHKLKNSKQKSKLKNQDTNTSQNMINQQIQTSFYYRNIEEQKIEDFYLKLIQQKKQINQNYKQKQTENKIIKPVEVIENEKIENQTKILKKKQVLTIEEIKQFINQIKQNNQLQSIKQYIKDIFNFKQTNTNTPSIAQPSTNSIPLKRLSKISIVNNGLARIITQSQEEDLKQKSDTTLIKINNMNRNSKKILGQFNQEQRSQKRISAIQVINRKSLDFFEPLMIPLIANREQSCQGGNLSTQNFLKNKQMRKHSNKIFKPKQNKNKNKLIIEIYKKLNRIRNKNPEKFLELIKQYNLPKSCYSLQEFSIYASKLIDKHTECFQCHHLDSLLN